MNSWAGEANCCSRPALARAAAKRARTEDFAFIWDVAANRGYLLNDPLQGYAPISYGRRFTNLAISAALNKAATENVAGHPCQQTEVTVAADDGSASVFRVWRATDLKGLPVRISGASDGTPVTLTLSKARLEAVPNDLFQPPNGFTKYDSAEVLINELGSRQHNLKQRPTYWPEEKDILSAPDARDAHPPELTRSRGNRPSFRRCFNGSAECRPVPPPPDQGRYRGLCVPRRHAVWRSTRRSKESPAG